MDKEERRMDPALYKAAIQGNVSSLRKLVDPDDPNVLSSRTPQGNTALHLTAMHGHVDFACEVLDMNEELLVTRNDNGDTPLHLAAKVGMLEVARLLINQALAWPQEKKSPLIMTNKTGNTAMHEAVLHGSGAVALALLDADPNRGHDLNEQMESPLHIAAREGLVQVVQRIVDYPWVEQYLPSVSVSGTALHQAVLGNNLRILEILLEKRPDLIYLTDSEGNNALHYAAQKDHQRAVEMLLKKRTELAYELNNMSLSPLHVAARYGSSDAIKALLWNCRDLAYLYQGMERRMDPALYKAATQGKVSSLKQLMDPEDPTYLSATTPQHNTALHLAALHGHAEFARMVLDMNEELFVTRNDDGDTPLHLAAKAGMLEVARLLINRALAWPQEKKSPLIMTNMTGNTAMHEAVLHGSGAVALALLDADPNRGHDRNERMESPLHIAAREGLVQVVQRIVNYTWVEQEYLPSVSFSGTALHQAVLGNNLRILEILLEKQPELFDQTDSEGNNALHYAAQKDHQRAVEMLLKKRTELAYKLNNMSLSPLHVAARYGSSDAIKALLWNCRDLAELVDCNGRNAFHASVISDKANALRCLIRHISPKEPLNWLDSNGDTPLHLAAKMSRVQCGLLLLNDRRVDPCVRDHDGQTARSLLEKKWTTGKMDTYEVHLWNQLKKQESKRCRKRLLPPTVSGGRRSLSNKDFDSVVDAYFLAATLIATVTFAATFTMPGGYDQTNGTPLLGHNSAFKIFVVSNTVAMCSSIVVIFLLIWARQEPVRLRLHNLMWSQTLTIVACVAMLISLMTAVYTTVVPKAPWPAYIAIAIGISSPALFFVISWMGR